VRRSRSRIFKDCFSLSNSNRFSNGSKSSGFEGDTRDEIGFIETGSDELAAAEIVFFGIFFGSV